MDYTEFFDEEDVATFRRVKRGQMLLATVAGEVAAALVGGTIQAAGKEFVHTRRGVFRLAVAENSDNSTEKQAHEEMGATAVVMGNDDQLSAFFAAHGVTDGVGRFKAGVRARLAG